jgi:hypothetical protein
MVGSDLQWQEEVAKEVGKRRWQGRDFVCACSEDK